MMPTWALPAVMMVLGGLIALVVLGVIAYLVLCAYMRRADRRQVERIEAKLLERHPATLRVVK